MRLARGRNPASARRRGCPLTRSCRTLKRTAHAAGTESKHDFASPVMREPSSIESARDEELDRALRLLRRGVDPARILDELSRRLMNKLIHAPTKALREAG